ncbi:MAG: hypothetical protein D3925_16280 [Candidatus Electrothrix sp. AR5]|nr:hypothetical protein [Candidatus Electrothrix sp. AR5]
MKNSTQKTLTLLCAALFLLSAVPQAFAGDEKLTGVNTELLGGFKFGVALGLTMDLGDNDRVESAEVVNGVVRVTKDNNYSPRIMLETHYFFTPGPQDTFGPEEFLGHKEGEWGFGPFVALQTGSEDIIEYIGAGIMLGFRRSEESTNSFNVGLGVVVDPSVKILGDGIVENRPLPEGEAEVRFKETSQLGLLAMVSYAF